MPALYSYLCIELQAAASLVRLGLPIVDTKNVTLPHQHQKLYGAASYYKQAKLLQASDLDKTRQKLQDLSK